jgi:putative zinc finger/helix-turn-helix YgiT family protein
MPTRCTNCGGKKFNEEVERRTRPVAGFDLAGEVPCTICDTCGERFYAADDLMRFDAAAAAALAQVGASSGEALKFMRKTMGITAAELAELLNLTPESISHVETGKREADRRTVALLGAMAIENLTGAPITLQRLRALSEHDRPIHRRAAGHQERHSPRTTSPSDRARLEKAIANLKLGKRRLDLTTLLAGG